DDEFAEFLASLATFRLSGEVGRSSREAKGAAAGNVFIAEAMIPVALPDILTSSIAERGWGVTSDSPALTIATIPLVTPTQAPCPTVSECSQRDALDCSLHVGRSDHERDARTDLQPASSRLRWCLIRLNRPRQRDDSDSAGRRRGGRSHNQCRDGYDGKRELH